MRKILSILATGIIMLVAGNRSGAQTLIHYWNFNNFAGPFYTPNIPPIDADYSDLDTSKARILYTEMAGVSDSFSTYEDGYLTLPVDSDMYNLQFGDTAGTALRLRNPSDSMYLEFFIPTTNFKNITVAYAVEASSTTHGMLQNIFSYSLDSGATWITSGGLSAQYDTVLTAFHLNSVSFTDTNANNNPKLVFRIAFGAYNSGTSGNDRVDNVTVTGDSIGGTSSFVPSVQVPVAAYTMYPNPVANTINIIASLSGDKTIAIYNDLGVCVYNAVAAGKNVSVDAAMLVPGDYVVNITENVNGQRSALKFTKQ